MRSKSSKSRRRKKRDPRASLPDDLVVDILSRLLVKSLCRCKGVSRRWRSLISHADHRRKFPQLHPSLFYCSSDSSRFPEKARHVTNVWEGPQRRLVCPSLSFLPGYERMSIVDCFGSILLCRFSVSDLQDAFRYVLCNPVRMQRAILPDSGCGANKRVARLAGAHIFEFVYSEDDERKVVGAKRKVVGANIFSIETEAWSYKEGGWFDFPSLDNDDISVYLNGYLFIVTNPFELSVVDVEGDLWCSILLPFPEDEYHHSSVPGFICIYKEQLC